MLRAQTQDGRGFRGSTPAKLVRSMKRRSWQHDARKGDYMRSVIDRVEQMTATRFTATLSPETFLDYLQQVGFIEVTRLPDE